MLLNAAKCCKNASKFFPDVIYLTFKREVIKVVILKLLYINYHVLKPLSYAIMSS
jgi:hypothetical protein